MELHELQKMISIIHDKKPRCRGNLRVKVLLKSTHDYVRRSLLDDQLGNSESLLTLLRNSGTVREPMSPVNAVHETDLHSMNSDQICSVVNTDTDCMDCDSTYVENDQKLQCFGSTNQNMKQDSENSLTMIEAFAESDDNQSLNNIPIQSVVSDMSECGGAFRNSNKNSDRNNCNNPKEKYSKLIKVLRKITKHWELLITKSKSDKSCFKHHCHCVKRTRKLKKLLLQSKICFKADFENQSFTQQQIIQMYARIIKKMLKQCDEIIERK